MDTPVLFIVFRRPETTSRVFEAIRAARPARLFIAANAPRPDRPEEVERCRETREIVTRVDWDCDVRTLFRDRYLTARESESSAMNWFFENVEEGIVLEDDCLPHPDFFPFCEELLDRYRDDRRIGHIGGGNFLGGTRPPLYSYYFSRYTAIWGWASWRRAWLEYDVTMALWPEVKKGRWHVGLFDTPGEVRYWERHWDAVAAGRVDTWDAQWLFSRLLHGTLSVIPTVNLVSNIGFGDTATNTPDVKHPFAAVPLQPLTFPLRHPPFMLRDRAADRRFAEQVCVAKRFDLRRWAQQFTNKHLYGKLLRQTPFLGWLWARLRGGRRRMDAGS